jgi:hypothetical protein
MKAWVLLVCILPLAGCSHVGKLVRLSKPTPPALSVIPTANGPAVTQSGDAAEPARVVTTETSASVPVPAGAVITISPPPYAEGKPNPEPLPVVYTVKSSDITGPRSHVPPPPPTPGQLANADAIRQSYFFAGALILGAGFLFWRGHLKAAAVASVSAVAVPMVANIAGSEWAQKLFIAGACIAAALFAGWHFMQDKKPKEE